MPEPCYCGDPDCWRCYPWRNERPSERARRLRREAREADPERWVDEREESPWFGVGFEDDTR